MEVVADQDHRLTSRGPVRQAKDLQVVARITVARQRRITQVVVAAVPRHLACEVLTTLGVVTVAMVFMFHGLVLQDTAIRDISVVAAVAVFPMQIAALGSPVPAAKAVAVRVV